MWLPEHRKEETDALGIILTGMGNDGAHGLHAMKIVGALTIAQDEKSCVVFGMPEQAIRLGAVSRVVSLERIADSITDWAQADVNPGQVPQRDKST